MVLTMLIVSILKIKWE